MRGPPINKGLGFDGGEKRKVRKKGVFFLTKSGIYNSTIYKDPTFLNEVLKRFYFEGTIY